ncbi:hypothetical protein Pint_05200 [Pistacia integerrima]|uniref:Uncharacterized protein n=1 Tax=Pistacia integerrima TaxID=434235 RepID=A0ACC0Z7I6_9ROSI|nr:hypothetical protein Pint_05200 [Pistacia integerrima]
MELECQNQPFHHHRDEEEEEEEVGLLVRQSRHITTHANGKTKEHALEAEEEKEDLNNEAVHENGEGLHKNSVYFDTQQGNESVNGFSGTKNVEDESVVLETTLKDEELHLKYEGILSAEITHESGKNLEDEILSSLSLPVVQMSPEEISIDAPTEITHENGKNFEDEIPSPVFHMSREEISKDSEYLNDKTVEDSDVDLIDEVDRELTAIDVERVLKKQNTHELYCPNCNSCITRTVTLRRKKPKPKVRNIPHRPKRVKSEIQSVPDANPAYATNGQDPCAFNSSNVAPMHVADDDNCDKQPEAFRCLSCFSIFIPTGNGFKIFRVFGDSNENKKMEDVQSVPASKKKWFFSIFLSDNKKSAIDQGTRATEPSEVDGINQHNSSRISDNILSGHENDHLVAPPDHRTRVETRAVEEDSLVKSQQGESESILPEKLLMDQEINMETENKTLAHCNGLDLSTEGALSPIKSLCSVGLVNSALIESQEVGKGTVNSSTKEPIPYYGVSSDVEEKSTQGSSSINPVISVGLASSVLIDSREAGTATVNSLMKEAMPYNGVSSDVREKVGDTMVNNKTGDDVIVNVTETLPVDRSSSLRIKDVDTSVQERLLPESGTKTLVDHCQGAAASEAPKWDILKSIVYGGLVESIASLGVVSSAAAAGASTLNVLALGLANLIGGLFIIAHTLGELRNECSGETEHQDRYHQQLGQRDKFSLHATVVVLSFLIFGLVPPVVYGFSFRTSDNVDYKLAAAAGSSLACIFLLAVGKAHVQTPPKSYIKRLLYYVILGVVSSGVSYVVGDLIKKLMEKLNWSESSIDFMIRHQMNPGWASY